MKCEVHWPKPKGAGIAAMKTSSSVRSPTSTAHWWKYHQRFCVCITHFGRPVVPEVELISQSSSGPRRSGKSAGGGPAGAPSIRIGASTPCSKRGTTTWWRRSGRAVAERGEVLAGGGAAVLVDGDQRGGAALGEDVPRLAFARPHADADRDDPRLLAAEEGGVDGAAVGNHDADPVAAAEPELDAARPRSGSRRPRSRPR